jgi:hypothetical protein
MEQRIKRQRTLYELSRVVMSDPAGAESSDLECVEVPSTSPSDIVLKPGHLRLISVQDAASLYAVNWRTFIRWADQGLVPTGLKIGGRRLFRVDELRRHIAAGCPRILQEAPGPADELEAQG